MCVQRGHRFRADPMLLGVVLRTAYSLLALGWTPFSIAATNTGDVKLACRKSRIVTKLAPRTRVEWSRFPLNC